MAIYELGTEEVAIVGHHGCGITGLQGASVLEKARAQGYEFEILAKPVHPQDLLTRLRG